MIGIVGFFGFISVNIESNVDPVKGIVIIIKKIKDVIIMFISLIFLNWNFYYKIIKLKQYYQM